jgi:hypothetical protein
MERMMMMMMFWVETPCGLVGRYRRFGETYSSSGLHLPLYRNYGDESDDWRR